ncbi:hypothetical protein ACH5RR_002818 [Cinchona calisaya]|uniref:Uncharacterized protein n=1 Tax=Cinchona calisaya TaxID=153742 RepID=A0ABD3ATP1_9GENT
MSQSRKSDDDEEKKQQQSQEQLRVQPGREANDRKNINLNEMPSRESLKNINLNEMPPSEDDDKEKRKQKGKNKITDHFQSDEERTSLSSQETKKKM